jgi:hypothetical protein
VFWTGHEHPGTALRPTGVAVPVSSGCVECLFGSFSNTTGLCMESLNILPVANHRLYSMAQRYGYLFIVILL